MAEYIKKCEYCGKEFVTKRCDTMFCCKKCGFKQWYEQNKEYNKEYRKQRYEQNKEYHKKYKRQHYKQNKERYKEYSKKWYKQNKKYYKQYREQNKEYRKEYFKEYNKKYSKQRYEQNKEYRKEYSKEYSKTKYNSDLQFKLSQWSRRQVWRCLSSNKTKRTFDILGYTTEQLKQRLEMNFKPDMNWSNHGTLWHIDHRKPLCKFNLTLPDGTPNYEQIRLANSLANLQPLYITENLSKNGKFELPTTKSLKVINC